MPAKAIKSEAANNKDDDNPEQQRVAQQETGGEIILGLIVMIQQPLATINQIISLQKQSNQTQQITKKEAQTRSWGKKNGKKEKK